VRDAELSTAAFRAPERSRRTLRFTNQTDREQTEVTEDGACQTQSPTKMPGYGEEVCHHPSEKPRSAMPPA